ncbi:MAG: hypothetical protein LBG17_08175 [Bacteroidales bacterium]|jgi:hypothetical protein|nr:hypothetical protein [Bacteroidales bacterium]
MKTKFVIIIIIALVAVCCKTDIPDNVRFEPCRPLFNPDVADITVPVNIAPVNFTVEDTLLQKVVVELTAAHGLEKPYITSAGKDGLVQFPLKLWKRLLPQNTSLTLRVFVKHPTEWIEYPAFNYYISPDSIDPFISYRLIEPSYQMSNLLTTEERCLENYDKRNIYDNVLNEYACVNCHTYDRSNPNRIVFHLRFKQNGTYISDGTGHLSRVDLISKRFPQGGIYPAWHPSGNYIVFSTNIAIPFVHSADIVRRTEVFDSIGDIIIYDIKKNIIITDSTISREDIEETFPHFTPDGTRLFYCRSITPPMEEFEKYDFVSYSKKIRYSLASIDFDTAKGTFIKGSIRIWVDGQKLGKTVSIPRVSPDGRYLVFCLSDHGTFPIRHPESDLYMIDLQDVAKNEVLKQGSFAEPYPHETKTIYVRKPDGSLSDVVYTPLCCGVNDTTSTESYHSWSKNSRWLMFSSKREDGLYSRPFFTHIDADGNNTKPFKLPQKDPANFYLLLFKSFNVPEFISGHANITDKETAKAGKQKIIYPEKIVVL